MPSAVDVPLDPNSLLYLYRKYQTVGKAWYEFPEYRIVYGGILLFPDEHPENVTTHKARRHRKRRRKRRKVVGPSRSLKVEAGDEDLDALLCEFASHDASSAGVPSVFFPRSALILRPKAMFSTGHKSAMSRIALVIAISSFLCVGEALHTLTSTTTSTTSSTSSTFTTSTTSNFSTSTANTGCTGTSCNKHHSGPTLGTPPALATGLRIIVVLLVALSAGLLCRLGPQRIPLGKARGCLQGGLHRLGLDRWNVPETAPVSHVAFSLAMATLFTTNKLFNYVFGTLSETELRCGPEKWRPMIGPVGALYLTPIWGSGQNVSKNLLQMFDPLLFLDMPGLFTNHTYPHPRMPTMLHALKKEDIWNRGTYFIPRYCMFIGTVLATCEFLQFLCQHWHTIRTWIDMCKDVIVAAMGRTRMWLCPSSSSKKPSHPSAPLNEPLLTVADHDPARKREFERDNPIAAELDREEEETEEDEEEHEEEGQNLRSTPPRNWLLDAVFNLWYACYQVLLFVWTDLLVAGGLANLRSGAAWEMWSLPIEFGMAVQFATLAVCYCLTRGVKHKHPSLLIIPAFLPWVGNELHIWKDHMTQGLSFAVAQCIEDSSPLLSVVGQLLGYSGFAATIYSVWQLLKDNACHQGLLSAHWPVPLAPPSSGEPCCRCPSKKDVMNQLIAANTKEKRVRAFQAELPHTILHVLFLYFFGGSDFIYLSLVLSSVRIGMFPFITWFIQEMLETWGCSELAARRYMVSLEIYDKNDKPIFMLAKQNNWLQILADFWEEEEEVQLVDYFLRNYRVGRLPPKLIGYDLKWDAETGQKMFQSITTGIKVWAHALDLTGSADAECHLVFKYTSRSGFLGITAPASQQAAAILMGIEERGILDASHGSGVYSTQRDPEWFRSSIAVLYNEHYAKVLTRGMQEIEDLMPRTKFAVPMLVRPDQFVDVRTQVTQELQALGISAPGIDKSGNPLFDTDRLRQHLRNMPDDFLAKLEPLFAHGRDLIVVQTHSDVRGAIIAAKGKIADVMMRRMQRLSEELGRHHTKTLTSIKKLALLMKDFGRLDEAERLFREVLEGMRETFGPQHPKTLDCMSHLAKIFHDQGRLDEAERLFREALEGMREQIGPQHPKTLDCMSHLAKIFHDKGRLDEAERLFREVLEGMREKIGPQHPRTLDFMRDLATLFQAQGRLQQ